MSKNQIVKPVGISDEVWTKAQGKLEASLASGYLKISDERSTALAIASGIHAAKVRFAVARSTNEERANSAFEQRIALAKRAMLATELERSILVAGASVGKAPKVEPVTVDGATVDATEAPALQ